MTDPEEVTPCMHTSLPGSSLLSSLPLRSHQKAPLRGLAPLILTSQTHATHAHPHIPPASSPFHSTAQSPTVTPSPLPSSPAPGGMGHLGEGGQGRTREDKSGILVLVKWSGGGYDAAFQLSRFLSHSPTSSSPHKDTLHTSPQGTVTPRQLHSAHGWIHLIVQRDGADHATSPLHGRLLERARSSSILHLQPSCASAHTHRNTQPHTTALHCPPSYTALSPFTSHRSVGRRNARGERENARVQDTGEQDGKWGTGTPRDLGSTWGPVISVGSGYPNPKILGLYLPARVSEHQRLS